MIRCGIRLILGATSALASASMAFAEQPVSVRAVVSQFCLTCHDVHGAKGGLNLAAVVSEEAANHPQIWEKVVRRLRGRQMPPAGELRLRKVRKQLSRHRVSHGSHRSRPGVAGAPVSAAL